MVAKLMSIGFVLDCRKRQVGKAEVSHLNNKKLTASIRDKQAGLQPVQKEE